MEASDVAEQSALGRRVRQHRQAAQLSQVRLGERIGLDPTAVSNIERGVRKVSSLELSRIARALSVSPLAILEGEDAGGDDAPPADVAAATAADDDADERDRDRDRDRALVEICNRYGVAELYIFGSTARGDASEASDVAFCMYWRPARVWDSQSTTSRTSWAASSGARSTSCPSAPSTRCFASRS